MENSWFLRVPIFKHMIMRLYSALVLGHLKIMNFPFGTNGKFIIFRCPNTISTLGVVLINERLEHMLYAKTKPFLLQRKKNCTLAFMCARKLNKSLTTNLVKLTMLLTNGP